MSETLLLDRVDEQIAQRHAEDTEVRYGASTAPVEFESAPDTETRLSLRQRIAGSWVGRTAVKSFAAVTFFGATGGAVIAETGTADASTTPVNNVTNAAAGGVYARYVPHVNSTNRTPGFGIHPGDKVELLCGITDGDAVGPYSNHSWDYVKDLSRSETTFWTSEHYTNSPNSANTLAPGETRCANESSNPLAGNAASNPQPAETLPTFASFNRQAAANWAYAHTKDKPPDAGSCTWFVSQALWAGGLHETSQWNGNFQGWPEITWPPQWRYGTNDAKITPDFFNYIKSLPYAQLISLGHMSASNNDLPAAKLGDVIIYDWTDDGTVDHADVVTGFSPTDSKYPLVSGWSEVGANAVNYKQRGWTWSQEHGMFLQEEPGHRNMVAYLIHFRSENDLKLQ